MFPSNSYSSLSFKKTCPALLILLILLIVDILGVLHLFNFTPGSEKNILFCSLYIVFCE